ncbi:MAG TPA: response regulator [Planctomycetaceae bacterium]|nr:response regulator [Planctomycetaceae bacterium]
MKDSQTQSPAILVVDDEVDNCMNLADIFSTFGYHIDMAFDGPSALEQARKRHYDVVLLDLRMPGMDGLAVYRELKKLQPEVVAIIVSAYASPEVAEAAKEAGAWEILHKPVQLDALLSLVEEAVGQPVVLVVDDDRDLCANLWDLFRSRGYRVSLAHSEPQAREFLESRDFQVVLIDLKLEEGHGGNVFRAVRERDPVPRTLIITGHRTESEDVIQSALREGADAVCYKPFNVPELLGVLQKLTER